MSIEVDCPACGKRLKAPARLAGKRAKCRCGAVLQVPTGNVGTDEPDVLAIEALAGEESAADLKCPSCGVSLMADAQLCTACGYHLATGKRVKMSIETGRAPEGKAKKKSWRKKRNSGEAKQRYSRDLINQIWIVFLLAAVAVVGWMVWGFMEYIRFDPYQQAKDLAAQIQVGITMAEVVEVVGNEPKHVYIYVEPLPGQFGRGLRPRRIEYAPDIAARYSEEELKYGIDFVYLFSTKHVLKIHFEPDGRVSMAEAANVLATLYGL